MNTQPEAATQLQRRVRETLRTNPRETVEARLERISATMRGAAWRLGQCVDKSDLAGIETEGAIVSVLAAEVRKLNADLADLPEHLREPLLPDFIANAA